MDTIFAFAMLILSQTNGHALVEGWRIRNAIGGRVHPGAFRPAAQPVDHVGNDVMRVAVTDIEKLLVLIDKTLAALLCDTNCAGRRRDGFRTGIFLIVRFPTCSRRTLILEPLLNVGLRNILLLKVGSLPKQLLLERVARGLISPRRSCRRCIEDRGRGSEDRTSTAEQPESPTSPAFQVRARRRRRRRTVPSRLGRSRHRAAPSRRPAQAARQRVVVRRCRTRPLVFHVDRLSHRVAPVHPEPVQVPDHRGSLRPYLRRVADRLRHVAMRPRLHAPARPRLVPVRRASCASAEPSPSDP